MQAPVTRSQLFVPGNRPAWFEKAAASGADALVIDLEDSVPAGSKPQARALASQYLRSWDQASKMLFSVRVNDRNTEWFLDDVCALVEAGAHCIALPKVSEPNDVIGLDCLISAIELRCHREPGSTLIHPLLETPSGIRGAYEIGAASPRVAYMGGLATPGGDIERGIGFRWTREGHETATFRSSVLLDARAARVPSPVTGLWADVSDLEGLRDYAQAGRAIGYDGMMVIHPSHVATVNEVFSPSPEVLERDVRLVEAMEAAAAEGSASIRFEGQMVDTAMAERAKERVAEAEADTAAPGRSTERT